RYGPNELKREQPVSFWYKLWAQFQDFLTLILLAAATVSFVVGERTDALLIFLIILVNAIFGLIQEGRAEKALTALKDMAAPQATLIRDGKTITIPANQLVPGDLVLLETGAMSPCDLRLSQTASLKIDEATLTGESVPVEKDAKSALAALAPLADRVNMAFAGTTVVYGRGQGLAVATGMYTEMGQIAGLLADTDENKTPLQGRLDNLGKILGAAILLICSLVFITGVLKSRQPGAVLELFLVAVSLAVAAIPEGLPAVVTIVLALGMQRMATRNAIVKRLQAVETLGSTTVICTDKTGTLTENKMATVALWVGGKLYNLAASGNGNNSSIVANGYSIEMKQIPELKLALMTAALCNDAAINNDGPEIETIGDPTECALLELAAKGGLSTHGLRKQFPRLTEIPFDSQRKIMTTVHKDAGGSYLVLTKGAPDVVLARSRQMLLKDQERPLTTLLVEEIQNQNALLAQKALRVLAIAYKRLPALPSDMDLEKLEHNLTFLGLAGLMDPLRPETKPALQECRQAGLRTIMITGDHPTTADAIGKELGLINGGGVLTGNQLDKLTATEFKQLVQRVNVFARVAPQHKSQIVKSLQEQGEIVAVTGDGVNDAPALKQAHIGVAMGITGTDVAKGAADMILADDNFASIIRAIKEGRTIYANIRKFVYFLLSCNIGEVLVVLLAQLLGLPLPLLPIHLLWLNLLTDAFPALALGLEQTEPGIMHRPPRPAQEPLLDRQMLTSITLQSILLTIAVLGVFILSLSNYDLVTARTMAFTTLVLAELLRSFTSRSETLTAFELGLSTNTALLVGAGLSGGLFLLTLYLPALRAVFHTVVITPPMWRLVLPAAALPATVAEIKKLLFRPKNLIPLAEVKDTYRSK
ncbi:MAG TPA: cation-translocating P-type ATPase, partial [bacterium]|nr:cation-translocating P-type ATPase [bacterium]